MALKGNPKDHKVLAGLAIVGLACLMLLGTFGAVKATSLGERRCRSCDGIQ